MAILSVSSASFRREVMESELPVLVELTSERSPSARQMAPRVENIARRFDAKLKVVRVNLDTSPELAQAFRVQNIPTYVVVSGGRPVKSAPGLLSETELEDLVEPFLPGADEEVPAKELPALLKAKRVTVVDVREAMVFQRAHIPGAKNVPLEALEAALPSLAAERRPVVLYDRANGDDVRKAFELLGQAGLPAARLKGGFLGWEGEGFDIERG